jgi:hypothetical protein
LPAVRRHRPHVDQIGVAHAVRQQARHADDAAAVARERDVLRLLERTAECVG